MRPPDGGGPDTALRAPARHARGVFGVAFAACRGWNNSLNDRHLDHTPMMAQYHYEVALNPCNSRENCCAVSKTNSDIDRVFLQ